MSERFRQPPALTTDGVEARPATGGPFRLERVKALAWACLLAGGVAAGLVGGRVDAPAPVVAGKAAVAESATLARISELLENQRYVEARLYALDCIQKEPAVVGCQRLLGDIYGRMGDRVFQERAYATFLQLAPEHPDAPGVRALLAELPTGRMHQAAVLHAEGRHADELRMFGNIPPTPYLALDPVMLAGLVADFAKQEPQYLGATLTLWPRTTVLPMLLELANGGGGAAWGAVRILDVQYNGVGLNLGHRYAAALESPDCGARAVAAIRLAELAYLPAVPLLKVLRDTEGTSCGQPEAARALKQLDPPPLP